ncbi:phage minor head protein [Haloarcula sp. 1CSR25-25]|uniref:phage minor head protein n=1 Tax=Haloarcula sp. 1CSR25-25 TaxID=2862545 RepID=UPI0028940BC1|nr:phage minor head protein [Haloarcula sp. 1CSR25-25]MDT3434696.1 hypothetical protein [Haloarcula sp. 1CSR25-25]
MCQHCGFLAKDSPTEDAVRRTFIEAFVRLLRQWHDDILSGLRDGDIRPGSQRAIRRTIGRYLDAYRDGVTASFETLYEDGAEAGRAVTIRRFDLDVNPRLRDNVRRELQTYAAAASDQMQTRMADDIARALREAFDDGLGQPEIEALLTDVFEDMRGYEAERAARTEGTAASARGAASSIRDAGAPGKVWLAEDDARTRVSHRDADGQVVPVGAQFDIDGHSAWWPGDPRLPMSERANCRCSVAPVWDL